MWIIKSKKLEDLFNTRDSKLLQEFVDSGFTLAGSSLSGKNYHDYDLFIGDEEIYRDTLRDLTQRIESGKLSDVHKIKYHGKYLFSLYRGMWDKPIQFICKPEVKTPIELVEYFDFKNAQNFFSRGNVYRKKLKDGNVLEINENTDRVIRFKRIQKYKDKGLHIPFSIYVRAFTDMVKELLGLKEDGLKVAFRSQGGGY